MPEPSERLPRSPPTDNCNGPLASTLPQSSFQSSSQSSASYAAYNAKLNRRDGECRRRLTRTVLWVHVVCFVLSFLGKMWSMRCEKFCFVPPPHPHPQGDEQDFGVSFVPIRTASLGEALLQKKLPLLLLFSTSGRMLFENMTKRPITHTQLQVWTMPSVR